MRLALASFLLSSLLPVMSSASHADQTVLNAQDLPLYIPDDISGVHPSLSDLLTIQPRVSIFHSYLREVQDIHERITSKSGVNTTLLVPTNKAVMALPRKPHLPSENTETMPEIDAEAQDIAYHQSSQDTLRRWIAAHVIPQSPISFDESYETLLDGTKISFTKIARGNKPTDFAIRVGDDEQHTAHIIDVKEAHNGVLYIIEGTVPVY